MLDFLKLLIPTRDQMTSYIRSGMKIASGALVTHGVVVSPELSSAIAGDQAIQVYTGIAMAIIPVLIDRVIHSDAGKLKSASTLAVGPDPVIKPIEALPTAPPAIQKLATDDSVPGVKAAPPAYQSPTSMRR